MVILVFFFFFQSLIPKIFDKTNETFATDKYSRYLPIKCEGTVQRHFLINELKASGEHIHTLQAMCT